MSDPRMNRQNSEGILNKIGNHAAIVTHFYGIFLPKNNPKYRISPHLTRKGYEKCPDVGEEKNHCYNIRPLPPPFVKRGFTPQFKSLLFSEII